MPQAARGQAPARTFCTHGPIACRRSGALPQPLDQAIEFVQRSELHGQFARDGRALAAGFFHAHLHLRQQQVGEFFFHAAHVAGFFGGGLSGLLSGTGWLGLRELAHKALGLAMG